MRNKPKNKPRPQQQPPNRNGVKCKVKLSKNGMACCEKACYPCSANFNIAFISMDESKFSHLETDKMPSMFNV